MNKCSLAHLDGDGITTGKTPSIQGVFPIYKHRGCNSWQVFFSLHGDKRLVSYPAIHHFLWNVYPEQREQPEAFISYFNSLTVTGAQMVLCFQIAPLSLLSLSTDEALLR